MTLVLNNNDLTLEDFINVAVHMHKVELGPDAKARIVASREVVENLVKTDAVAYGITTGFGSLSTKKISSTDLVTLQYNLIRSTAVGTGEPSPAYIVRGMFLLRLKCFTNGNSGIRLCIAEKIVEALNKNFLPNVPIKGSLGASGDLCPLSHLLLAHDPDTNKLIDAKTVLAKLEIEKITLESKEGLGLNNGTQFITSWTAFATYHALRIIRLSSVITATTIEALHGIIDAFDPRIHQAKPHPGQIEIAKQIRSILCDENGLPSDILQANQGKKIQDAYSLRCSSQIHGSAYDLIKFVESHVLIEMNCSNDNPLIFGDDILSGGNFHGAYISVCADQLALAFSHLCNISERRTERMINSDLNEFMPSFLTPNPGLNSGFMIVQYTSAGITAENRQLANPGGVHNIPSCQGFEDIVSMANWPARKAVQSMENTYEVIALELFTANQALWFTKEKPNQTSQKIIEHIHQTVPFIETDVYMGGYIKEMVDFVHSDKIFELVDSCSHSH